MYKGKERVDGKTVLITGGNLGIGKETAKELAKRGARVIIASRDVAKSESVKEEIIAACGNKEIFSKKLDLSSFASVHALAEDINTTEERLDILINNAGISVTSPKKSLTEDNLERTMAINYFGPFLLTNLLLDKLKSCRPSRIVILSSIIHKNGVIQIDNLNSERSYARKKLYANSKLANLLHARELARKLSGTGVTVYAVHPGAVDTGLLATYMTNAGCCCRALYCPAKLCVVKSPVQGAQTSVAVAVSEKFANDSGKYYDNCKEKQPYRNGRDDALAAKLWDASIKITRTER